MTENTITALRILQAGIEGVAAVGSITLGVEQTAAKTLVIGDITYTWRAVIDFDAPGELTIGTNLATQKAALITAINGTDGINPPNPYVTAGVFTGDVLPLTARIPGPFGNTIIFTLPTPVMGNSVNGAGFLGGTTPGSMDRGDEVAATARLAIEQLVFAADDEKLYLQQVQNGNLTRHHGPGTPVQHGTRFALPSQAFIWEQAPLLFSWLYGAPAVTGGLAGPWTMVWTQSPTANPNPYSVTLERRLSNGLGDDIDENASYAMLPELGLSFAVNEDLKLEGSGGFAREFAIMGGGLTPNLVLPSFEVGVSALSSAYFDTLFANVGDTLLAEQVIGWSLKLLGGIFPRYTAEGRSDLSFTKHQINGNTRGMDLQIQALLDPDTYAAEKIRASSPATNQFAVRIHVDGSAGRSLDIDMMMQHSKPLFPPGTDEGQDVVTFDLVDATDGTDFLVITLTSPTFPVLA